jgi:HAD superfamily hydrolase (TIGR01509 family)
MSIPQVVVFDLGKVLVDFDYSIAARKLAARGKMLPDELKRFIDHSPLLFRYETGLLSRQQFYTEICAATGYCGNIGEFGAAFADIFVPIDPMVRVNEALRKAGIPTYIFSNTNDLAIEHIRNNFPFFNNFNGYVLSYEHGAMKPDPKIYEVVEKQVGHHGSAVLYLDDRAENIATGAARGWQVILQETPEKTRAALQKLGLLSPPGAPEGP